MFESLTIVPRIFAAEGSSGIAALGVDLKSLLLQIATFVLVFWLLKKFAFAKIISALDERRRTIDQGVDLGIKMAEEKQRLDQQVEELLHKARLEADKIITAGQQDVAAMLKSAEDDAARKADALLADARARIEDDIVQARKSLESETLKLVAEASEILIQQRLDAPQDRKMIEKALQAAKQ